MISTLPLAGAGCREGGIRNREHIGSSGGLLKALVGSEEFWKNSEKGEKGRRRRGGPISGSLDACGPRAVRLDLRGQEGREKGDGAGQ